MTPETNFMVMNTDCYVCPSQKYNCNDVPYVLIFDIDEKKDIKYICNKSKVNDFTNQDLADIVNSQFKEQCPTMFNQYCVEDCTTKQ